MELGTAIKILRKERNISQGELSKLCGMSQNSLSLIECNSAFPHKKTLKLICAALKVSMAYVLFYTITDEDVPVEKRMAFTALTDVMKQLLSTAC